MSVYQPNSFASSSVVYIVGGDVAECAELANTVRDAGLTAQAFGSEPAFLDSPRTGAPCVAVIEVSRSGVSACELLRRLSAERPEMPVIFVTGDGDIPMSVRAMKAGAFDFLPKPLDTEALVEVIQDAVERSQMLRADQAELERLRDRHALLTRREQEVMACVVSGLLNKQVAGRLGISEITVKAHRGQVMRKMQARSFASLVNQAARLGVGVTPK